MGDALGWWLAAITVAVLLAYQVLLAAAGRRRPERLARAAHATLREQWLVAVSAQKGSEVLGVQTLRNSLMSATMTASTSVLALMGTVSLAAPSLNATFGSTGLPQFTPRLAMELVLIALLFASLVASVMAVRYYHHASFIVGMPVESDARRQWSQAGVAYLGKAGRLYGWSLRYLLLVVPVVAFILHPVTGPVAALLVVGVLYGFDRFSPAASA
jgi:uncharacterized membrane protein